MTLRCTLVTDGTPTAIAIWRWVEKHAGPQRTVAARGPADVSTVVSSRRSHRTAERTIVLAGSSTDVTVSAAYALAAEVLLHTLPIEARIRGAEILDTHRLNDDALADALDRLLNLVQPRPMLRPERVRAGRPPGSNPFRGAGFDICVALLLQVDRRWTERDLAAAALRSPSQVHKVLRDLGRRGYVASTKTGHTIRDPLVLRDELAAAWRGRVGLPRAGLFALVKGKTKLRSMFRIAMRANRRCSLAGASATTGGAGLVGGTPTLYLELDDSNTLPALEGIEQGGKGVSDVIIWAPPEPGVFVAPRSLGGGLEATNRVVTYLDLLTMGTDRGRFAAEALWEETAQ